jgi:hypothetical protein
MRRWPTFGFVVNHNGMDCRTENELDVAEIGNWRVQKLTLHPN